MTFLVILVAVMSPHCWKL